jgi:hypothetical protein
MSVSELKGLNKAKRFLDRTANGKIVNRDLAQNSLCIDNKEATKRSLKSECRELRKKTLFLQCGTLIKINLEKLTDKQFLHLLSTLHNHEKVDD